MYSPAKLKLDLLNLEMRVLHLIVAYILFPKAGSFTLFTIFDSPIMYHIKNKVKLDLPSMMVTHMISSTTYARRVVLPYGMYLTRVFEYFGVDLSSKHFHKIHESHTYSESSVSRMGYEYDYLRKA